MDDDDVGDNDDSDEALEREVAVRGRSKRSFLLFKSTHLQVVKAC